MISFQKTLPLVFILCIFAACHKTKTHNISPLAIGENLGYITQAIEITNGDTETFRFVYNPDNTLDSVIDEGNCVGCGGRTYAINYYSYSSPYIHIFYSEQDTFNPSTYSAPWEAYRIHLINDGMCDSIFSYELSGPESSYPEYIKYNGTQIDTFFYLYDFRNRTSSTGADAYIYNSNGDISTRTTQDSTYTYNYDLTHSTQVGDPVMFNQLITYGIIYTRCSHLTTSINNNADNYAYTFDSKGRVATVNETRHYSNDTSSTKYIYQYKD